jgi:NitT/TauT family transport system permease protein
METVPGFASDPTATDTVVRSDLGDLGEIVERDTPQPKPKGFNPVDLIGPLIVFGLVIGLWYFMSMVGLSKSKRFLLPRPHKIIHSFVTDDIPGARGKILNATWLSAKVALLGLVIAIILGIGIAIIMSQAKWVEKSLWPYLIAMQAVPILTLTPIIGALFGFSFKARLLVTVIIALFPISSNTLFGLLSVDKGMHDLLTLHGASRWTRLTKLQLPAALPQIFTGFRISAGLAVIGAIVGDTFFRQGKPGLGSQVDVYRSFLQGPQMWACIILAALLGLLFFAVFEFFNRLAIGKWHDSIRV